MKRFPVLCLPFFVLLSCQPAAAPPAAETAVHGAVWARTALATPPEGGGLLTGLFRSAAAGPSTITAVGHTYGAEPFDYGNGVISPSYETRNYRASVVRYNSGGTPQWGRWSSGVTCRFYGAAVDSSGAIYAVGLTGGTGSVDFGSSVSVTNARDGVFPVLVKYDADGTPQWARTITSLASPNAEYHAVALDTDGNIYVAGFLGGASASDFGDLVTATGTPSGTALLVKYSGEGVAQWARTPGTGTGTLNGVQWHEGNLYAAGEQGTASLLVKYSSSGDSQWTKTAAGSSFDGLALGTSDDLYVIGTVKASADFGDGVAITAAGTRPVLVKYRSSGVAQWADTVSGGDAKDSGTFTGVAVDSSGKPWVTGSMPAGTLDLGNSVTVSSPGSMSTVPLVASYSESGTALAVWTAASGEEGIYPWALVSDGSNHFYAVGSLVGPSPYAFGNAVTVQATAAAGSQAPLIVKYQD